MQKASEDINSEFRARLREEFSRRLRTNARYSLRAFAAHIDVDSSTLSQILAGKRQFSEEKIKAICKRLGLIAPAKAKANAAYNDLSLDTFAVISDWYHFAILDLTFLKGFKSDSKWIARKLGVSIHEVETAVKRLKRLGMLQEKNGVLVKAEDSYTNYSEGVTSAALKEYQRQIIRKALHAIDNCPQERKDITSITIPTNSKKLKLAKEKIKNFRRELCAFLEDGELDSVFHLAVQLYPVTDLEN